MLPTELWEGVAVIPKSATVFLVAGGAALVGANVVAATGYLDVVREPAPLMAAQDAATKQTPPPDNPGNAAVRRLIGRPLAEQMTVRAGARSGANDVLKPTCGTASADVAAVAYQRPVAIGRKPLVAGVELWPTGYGAAAIAAVRQRAQACAERGGQIEVEGREVAGYPAVLVTITSGYDRIQTLRWSVGDITLSLTGKNIPLDDKAIKAWSRRATALLTPICPDLKPTVGDARRSPWRDPGKYVGLRDHTTVESELPPVNGDLPPRRPELLRLSPIERPDPPAGVPYWPARLPAKQAFPDRPTRPERPDTKRPVTFPIPDPTGPGCGWAFTASPQPRLSQAESDKERERLVAETTRKLKDELSQWAAAESQWRAAMGGYYVNALAYREYSTEVARVGRAWDAIRADWNRYNQLVAQRQRAIIDRQQWLAASKAWQTTGCPTAAPSPAPGAAAAPAAPPPGCTVPQILWRPLPQIPPEPSRPADPRPPSAR